MTNGTSATMHAAPGATVPTGAALATAALVILSGCQGPRSDDAGPPTALPLLTLAEPSLEIGVVEGDDAYTFASVDGVVRLENGSVAVSDGGNTRISVYDGAGTFVRSWGARGEGPGEFRVLSRIYPSGPDSLMAADNATARLSVFDLTGAYARQVDGVELSEDSTFRLDSWLHGRFWVDGALDASARARARAALDRLPPPRQGPGYRRALVARDGDLWILEPDPAPGDDDGLRSLWTRLRADGSPEAVVEMPSRFTPLDVLESEILGAWSGPAEVSFVRVYPITETGETRPAPAWLRSSPPRAPGPGPAGPSEEEFSELMRGTIRGMATAQEIHYSEHYSYTTALDSLDFEAPQGLGVDFTHATPRGWAAVFVHPTADRLCGLAYGAGAPPGWQAGGIVCGRPSASPGA